MNTSSVIGRFSGSQIPPVVVSCTSSVIVTFVSDRSISGMGFTASFESRGKRSSCSVAACRSKGCMFEDVAWAQVFMTCLSMSRNNVLETRKTNSQPETGVYPYIL